MSDWLMGGALGFSAGIAFRPLLLRAWQLGCTFLGHTELTRDSIGGTRGDSRWSAPCPSSISINLTPLRGAGYPGR